MNETAIIKQLMRHFANYDYRLQNVFIFDWESDFFAVSSSGYSIEVEVKISKSDFKADFKKSQKHLVLKNAHLEKLVIPQKYGYSPVEVRPFAPNQFFYCCPDGLISPDDLPDYAGLLYLKEVERKDWRGEVWKSEEEIVRVRNAKYLHKNKPDLSKILLSKFYYLYCDARVEYSRLRDRLSEIEKRFNCEVTLPNQKHYENGKVYEQNLW